MAGNCPNPLLSNFWQALERLKAARHYDGGSHLFRDGEPCTGLYLVERGEIHLLIEVRPRQYKILETAQAGAVLGLSETMSGSLHKLTAEAVGPVEVAYIERMALMKFLPEHREVCMQIVSLLSDDLHGLYRIFRTLPAAGKSRKKNSTH